MTSFRTFATCAVCAGSLSLAACHTSGSSGGGGGLPALGALDAFASLEEGPTTVYTPGNPGTAETQLGGSLGTSARTVTLTRPTSGANQGKTVITIDDDGAGTVATPDSYVFADADMADGVAISENPRSENGLMAISSDALFNTRTRHSHLTLFLRLDDGRTDTSVALTPSLSIDLVGAGTPTAAGDLPGGSAVAYSGNWVFLTENSAAVTVVDSDYFTALRDARTVTGAFDMQVDFSNPGSSSFSFSNQQGAGTLSGGTLANDGTFTDMSFTGSNIVGGPQLGTITFSNIGGRFLGPQAAEVIGADSNAASGNMLGLIASKN